MGLVEALRRRPLEAALASAALGLAVGEASPSIASLLKTALPAAIFAMILQPMYALDVSRAARGLRRKLRFIGIVTLLYAVVFPLTALLYFQCISSLSASELRLIAAGALLVALAPVAMPAPTFVAIAGGDVELSLLSVVWTFALSFIVIPCYAYIALHTVVRVPAGAILRALLVYIALPFVVGQVLRRLVERVAGTELAVSHARVTRVLTMVSLLSLCYVIFASFAASVGVITAAAACIVLLVATLFVYFAARFALAYMLGRLLRLERGETIALVYAASGNGAIGIALSSPLGTAALTGAVLAGPLVLVVLMTAMLRFFAAGGN